MKACSVTRRWISSDALVGSRSGLGAISQSAQGGERSKHGRHPAYKSDVYVFCFQHELDPARWDALDLAQWEFYLIERAELERINTKRVTLLKLRQMGKPMTARECQRAMRDRLATRF